MKSSGLSRATKIKRDRCGLDHHFGLAFIAVERQQLPVVVLGLADIILAGGHDCSPDMKLERDIRLQLSKCGSRREQRQ